MRSPREGARSGTPPSGFASFRAQPNRLLDVVLDTLDDAKAEDVVSIDLKGKTSIGDQMVVASGRSQRHVAAVADHLIRKLKEEGFGRARVEGLPHGDWVLIDAGDVIVHIFRPEVREFYNLEKMWSADRPMERMVI
jgi:ribosome-associated protein